MDINVTLSDEERAVVVGALLEYRDYLDQIEDDERIGLVDSVQDKLKGKR